MKPLFPSYILVDFKNTAWRAFAAGGKEDAIKTSEGLPSGHVLRFFRMIQKAKKELGGELVFCMEGGEKLRYELFPTYKQGRSKETPWLEDLVRLARSMKCLVVTPKEAEADDAIATFISLNKEARHCIISADKDLWALLGSKTRIISFQKEINQEKVIETFGVKPESVPLAKALTGDSSDCLPGVPKLRWKEITPIMEGCITPTDLFSKLDNLPIKTKEKLIEYKEQIETIYKVACLRNSCELNIEECGGDSEEMISLLNKFECNSLLTSTRALLT